MNRSRKYRRPGYRHTGDQIARVMVWVLLITLLVMITIGAATLGMHLGGADVLNMPLIEHGTTSLGDLLGI